MTTTLLNQQALETADTKKTFDHQPGSPLYVDVRTPQEFEMVHIPNAWNIPLPDLHLCIDQLHRLSQDRPIRLVCRTQNRVKIAYEYLTNNGLTNCEILEGGITSWMAQDKPVIKGKQRVSLEGQVRAIAGGLIVLGVALGFTIHSGFFLLPALVGVGLLHAGLTDSCLMGMVLAKLPMNRIRSSPSPNKKEGDPS